MNTPLPHLTTTATHPPPKKETEREGGGGKRLGRGSCGPYSPALGKQVKV